METLLKRGLDGGNPSFNCFMGKPQKNNLFATNLSYRLPIFKIISGMTNIITAVMLIVFSLSRTMFFMSIKKWGVFLTTLQAHNFCK